MYCTQCGYNNPISVQYCKNCEIDLRPNSAVSNGSNNAEVLVYAGFWTRFLAEFLDLLLIAGGVILMLIAIAGLMIVGGRDNIVDNHLAVSIFYIVIAGLSLAYFILMESGEQCATFGKRWMNIKILDTSGRRLSPSRALGRLIARFLTHLSLLIGFLIQPVTPRKQALHDLLAKTIVVKASESQKISVMATLLVLFFALMVPALALFATAGLPVFQQHIQKVQLEKGMQVGAKATSAVARFYHNNGRVPAVISEADRYISTTSHISAIDINQQNGEITLTFSEAERKAIRSKHLLFTPAVDTSQSIFWKCHSNDIDTQILPATCK